MNVLPNFENAAIPVEKLTNYSLDYDKDYDKAEAFNTALGYNLHNYEMLIGNVNANINRFEAAPKGNNGYGDVYEVIMSIMGVNGKTANVLTSWIIENGTQNPRLTNIYVTKKKVRGESV
jgi:hypothetical protein